MENQSSSTAPPPMQFLLLEQVQFLQVQDDSLLQWELVDVVDAEEEEERDQEQEGGDDDDDDEDEDGLISWCLPSPDDDPIEAIVIDHRSVPVPVLHLDADVVDHQHQHVDVDVDDDHHEEDEDEADDDRCDLDDELVPWDVGNKLGRQRMKKLGKRAFSKMKNSKKAPYMFVRPGCVGGKHGLGLKHSS